MADASGNPSLLMNDPEDAGGRSPAGATLFEVAWEVCNQVGGIYQVIRSKIPLMNERWGDRYYAVGPYVESKANLEFEATRPTGWIGRALATMEAQGLKVHHGRWLVPGRPRALLLETWLPQHKLAEVKYQLWADHGIEFPGGDMLVDGVVSFSHGLHKLFEALCDQRWSGPGTGAVTGGAIGSGAGAPRAGLRTSPRIILAHFHEWMGGLCIPNIRRANLPVASVFTTHATLLGRYLASADEHFYDRLSRYDHSREAQKFNIGTQHNVERACAHGCHVFTTVSSITAEECSSLLGRPIDVVLPNGLSVSRYNAGHEQQTMHGKYKNEIHKFVMGHFFPSYSFDLDKTLYVYTSGRFEPRNKGFDLCLETMARLNAEMKANKIDKTIVFFIVSSRPTRSLNPLALEKHGVLNELNDVCRHITDGVSERLFKRAAAGEKLRLDDLIEEYWMLRYRRTQQALKQPCLPMVVTHILQDDADDPVLNQMRYLGLINRQEDPVKVVYHPEFINPANPLWGIEYDQFVRGCHLGLFPSAYEPWGYTPLESIAMGVPAITSDLAGFGRYVAETMPDHDEWGLTVLRRRGRSFGDAASDLTQRLLRFCKLERRERIAMRNEVDRHSWDFDWERLGPAYHTAHDLAVERFFLDERIVNLTGIGVE